MESCKTPSNTDVIEFQFDHVSTPIITADYIQKMHNLVIHSGGGNRCFTPMASDCCSPGLSPIFGMQDGSIEAIEAQQRKDQFNFPVPIASTKQYKKISPTTRVQHISMQQQQQQQQPQQQQVPQQEQKQINENAFWNDNSSFELDLSTSTKLESSLDNSSRSEVSKSSCILNHTLNVTLLLKELGLGQYSEKFAKEGIDLEKFLNINKVSELKSLGLQSDEDCKAIIDMVVELNSTQTLKI